MPELISPPRIHLSFHALTWNPFCNPFIFMVFHLMGGVPPSSNSAFLGPLPHFVTSLPPYFVTSFLPPLMPQFRGPHESTQELPRLLPAHRPGHRRQCPPAPPASPPLPSPPPASLRLRDHPRRQRHRRRAS